jgi:hypothetical protein
MSDTTTKTCIYPGCERPAVPPHPLGGPQPAFCDLEEHNALSAHQERQRLAKESAGGRTMVSDPVNEEEVQPWLTRRTEQSFCASTRPARWCSA